MVGSRVYVGGLPYGVRERDLEKFFKGFGRTRDILIKNGYGFVEFDDYRDADDAVYELNGKELLGERVVVEPARGIDRARRDRFREPPSRGRPDDYRFGPPTRTDYRLIVENLSSRISWQDLKDYMRQAGEVTYADAHKQHHNEGGRGQSKSSGNTGVVEFASHSDMRAAIDKLDNTELNGRRIRLVEDRRSSRRRSRSSSRSRSRSRRRSRTRSRSRRSSRSRSRSKSKPKKTKSPEKSRSRSHAKSPAAKPARSRSRSKSGAARSRSKSPARRPRSKSPARRPRSQSPARRPSSQSPARASRSRSRSAARPAARSPAHSQSRERSRSRTKDGSAKRDEARKSASRSRSRSPSRSRSRSRSGSPRRNGTGEQRAGSDRDQSPGSGD